MTNPYLSREYRQKVYDQAVAALIEMSREREQHELASPDCGSAPLCCGTATGKMVILRRLDPERYSALLFAAVGELTNRRRREADAEVRMMRLEMELVDAREKLADGERRLAEWNEAADAVYPADPA